MQHKYLIRIAFALSKRKYKIDEVYSKASKKYKNIRKDLEDFLNQLKKLKILK